MQREVNEEKRAKFMEFAGKRVNNVLHDIQILEPMARSNSYDFTGSKPHHDGRTIKQRGNAERSCSKGAADFTDR